MRYVLSSFARLACPRCGSFQLACSRDKPIYDYVLRTVYQIKPYRCSSCDYRHYRYCPSNTHGCDALPSALN